MLNKMLRLVWLAMAIGVVTGFNDDIESDITGTQSDALLKRVSEMTIVTRSKAPRYKFSIQKEKIFNDTNVIPEDHQVSAYIQHGTPRLFFFLLHGTTNMLSFIVTPCSSEVFWTLVYRHSNDTGKLDQSTITNKYAEPPLNEYSGKEPRTFTIVEARQGLYQLQVKAIYKDTTINLFASHQPLSSVVPRQSKIRLQKRQRKRKLTIRWKQSELDPFDMHYCIVINKMRDYTSMCEARNDASFHVIHSLHNKRENLSHEPRHPNIIIGCVKKKTSFTVDNLEPGQKYFFNLFVINKKTNLSVPYGNITVLFDNRTRALGLKDNKPVIVSLRRLDGKAVFRYKVTSKAKLGTPLQWHVLPCGGSVDAEIKSQRKTIIPRQRISGYTKFTIDVPKPGQRYALHIVSTDPEELQRISGVEVVATMQGAALPLGLLPEEAHVTEYIGLRQCNSVTIGWRPVSHHESARYCILTTELSINPVATELIPLRPNQCGLDKNQRSSTDYLITHCTEKSPNDYITTMTQQINNLKAGRRYVIQVMVKKSKGKTLSYDLLYVETKSKCT